MAAFVHTTGINVFLGLILSGSVLTTALGESSTASEPRLHSIYSGTHTLEEIGKGAKAIVLVFMDTECPVAQRYLPRLGQIHEQYKEQGARMFGIYANTRLNVWSMAVHAHDGDISFPVFLDEGHRLADRLDVQTTPEVVVLDSKLNRVYQGAIDDQFSKRGTLAKPSNSYLEAAVSAVLGGRPPAVSRTTPSGCPLIRQKPLTLDRAVTYHRDIAPILERHCQACHRDQGVGPFALASYEDAYYNAERIATVVRERRMPPWHGSINPEFGEFHNDKRLPAADIATLLHWVRTGAPQGEAAEVRSVSRRHESSAWEIGKPDYVYRMPQPFQVPKHGVLEYQFFRVPLGLTEDRWFRAVQVKPGNAEVVHHVAIHLVPSAGKEYRGLVGMAELYGLNAQRGNVICDYVPGDLTNAKTYPPDQAVRIPKDCDLVYEVHYTPNNRAAATDQSQVAFIWAKGPPQEEVLSRAFRKPIGRFRIPSHHPHYRIEDSYYFESDVVIDAVRPHFHLRGKSYRLEIVERNLQSGNIEKRKTVFSVPAYDPNWQRTYEFKTPVKVLAGTELLATGHFDNSSLNPNNPDPNAVVEWGQQTTDEMFNTRFRYRLVK